ncbi:MAG: SURF1 family protein, partial [Pikeienuella sp.]
NAEYRRVVISGRYLPDSDVLVKAVSDLGAGYWVMTPLTADQGWTLLINRGFVPAGDSAPETRPVPEGRITVAGLLRLSQPGGGFLRDNDPQADRWYSRDTAAIAASRNLPEAAPYFIDAEAGPDPRARPVGGLTVVRFRNSHLVYALTWFALAALWAAWLAVFRRRRAPTSPRSVA